MTSTRAAEATTAEKEDVARLEPLPRERWSPSMFDALQAMLSQAPPRPAASPPTEGQARGSNVLGMFANHPALAKAYLTFNGYLLYGASLGGRDRELVILRVAAVRGAEYEWAQHVQIGRAEGLTGEEIERIITGPAAEGWSPSDSALLSVVDELLASARISDATWSALVVRYDRRQLMDLVFTIGAYELLAMAFNAFHLQMEDSLKLITPRLPERRGT
ncbi:MAG: carboxymuconolactone decarboxylase family protein [Labilithrix sp.]|nr:carboxymuconolactone decarboxylase family protein [Labilithrix sp.]